MGEIANNLLKYQQSQSGLDVVCAIETIHTVGSDDSVLETMNFFRFFVDNSKTKARNDFFDLFNEFYAILKLIILALVVKIKIFVLDIGRSIFADHRLEKVRQFFFIGLFYRE